MDDPHASDRSAGRADTGASSVSLKVPVDGSDRLELSASVFDAAPLGMLLTTPDGRVLWINEAAGRLAGRAVDQLAGNHLAGIVHPDDRQRADAARRQAASDPGRHVERQERWIRPDGSSHTVAVHAVLAVDPEGRPLSLEGDPCLIEQVLDITDQTEIAAELRRSNDELERFAYVASHDLKEPLRVVAGHVDLLASRLGDQLDEQSREWMGHVVDGARRMRDLIDDLLRYSRITTQRAEPRPVDLDIAVDGVVRSHASAIAAADAEVSVAPDLPTVMGDGSQFGQLLANLLANSLRYRSTDDRPRISISAQPADDGWAHLVVTDNGPGIPPEHRERAFEMFKRLHPRDEHAGTGMGLALCRRIVEAHGGRIWIDDGRDGGISVHFTLPLSTQPQGTDAET